MAGADWLSGLGQDAYSWGSNNPLGALSLGVGAFGTGMGIYDQFKASEEQQKRRKLAESMMRMGPTAYNPNWSPQQLEATYFRPASTFMAERGITSGGAFTQGLADAALKAEGDRNRLGNEIFQSRLGALGYGPTRQPTGNTQAFGSALQNLMLMNAMRYRPQNGMATQAQQPGATYPGVGMVGQYPQGIGGVGSFYPSAAYGDDQQQSFDSEIPSFGLTGRFGLPSGAPGDGRYSLNNPFGMGVTESLEGANRAMTAYPDLESY